MKKQNNFSKNFREEQKFFSRMKKIKIIFREEEQKFSHMFFKVARTGARRLI